MQNLFNKEFALAEITEHERPAVLYASTSVSRWHESSHGTAFKTDRMNHTLCKIESFVVMRESTVWH